MSRTRVKAVGLFLAVFLLGGVAGGGIARTLVMRELAGAMRGPPDEARARFRLESMRRHLDLDEAQTARIEAILAEADTERDELVATCRPGLETLRARTEGRIDEVLRPEQRAAHEEVMKRRPGRGPGRHRERH